MSNYEKVTASPEVLGAFLSSLPVATGPWDESFHEEFCNSCKRKNCDGDGKGVLWHSTGANNPTLKRYVQPSDNDPDKAALLNLLGKNANGNDWNHIQREAGLNCWIGKLADGTVTTVQTMPWNYRPWGCGSGSKGSCNSGWVQFEICEDGLTDADYFSKVYREACEITAYICKLYGIDPHGTVTVNGVEVPTILCHQDSYRLGFGSNHGDVLHWFPKFGKTMDMVRDDVAAILAAPKTDGYTAIAGSAQATAGQMRAYIKAKNPAVPQSVLDMVPMYLTEGAAEGIRGDIAFAQSCLETGNFAFAGSAVTLDQNNFCGMGVTSNGMKGNSFATPQLGIRAQIQHLKAYASTAALNGECVDPRFSYVTRGCAEYVEWLGQQENPDGKGWATGAGYGGKILSILKAILAIAETETEEEEVKRYNKISEMPGYAQPTIIKMVDAGLIGGTGTGAKDENNRPADLDLSMDMIRVFVTNDRAGLYDKK